MRAVLQRVKNARVDVDGETVGRIDAGLLVLVAVQDSDNDSDIDWMAQKLVNLRVFNDDKGKMNKSLLDTGGSVLLVSQFTLYGDCRNGRRPSYIGSAGPDIAEPAYEATAEAIRRLGVTCETGRFGAMMDVHLVNDGPVTLIVDTPEKP